jgi:hypothetical protein
MEKLANTARQRRAIKYANGRERCPECKGQISYSSEMRDKLPIGFGFVGTRFQIDALERRGFGGECMDCLAPVFAVKTRRHLVRYLKLNARQARKVGGRK